MNTLELMKPQQPATHSKDVVSLPYVLDFPFNIYLC